MLQKWWNASGKNKWIFALLLSLVFFSQCSTQKKLTESEAIEEFVYRVNFVQEQNKPLNPSKKFVLPILPGLGISGIPDMLSPQKEDIQCQCMDYDTSLDFKKTFLFSTLLKEGAPIKAFEPLLLERCRQVTVFLKNLEPSRKYQLRFTVFQEKEEEKLILKEMNSALLDVFMKNNELIFSL